MHTPSHRGSARVTAALRRFKKEHANMQRFASELTAFLDSITVIKPANVEDEDWLADGPSTREVLENRVSGYKIRVGNKFGSVQKCGEMLAFLDGEIADHKDMMQASKNIMQNLVGSNDADKLCAKAIRENGRG